MAPSAIQPADSFLSRSEDQSVPNTGRIGDKSIGYPLRGMSAGLINKETPNQLRSYLEDPDSGYIKRHQFSKVYASQKSGANYPFEIFSSPALGERQRRTQNE